MKKRRPAIVYLLHTFTFSIYFFFWIFFIVKEINEILGNKVFNLKIKIPCLVGIFIVYLGLVVTYAEIAESSIEPLLRLAISNAILIFAILWLIILIRYIQQICTYIAKIERDYGTGKPISKGITTIMIFIYLIAMINVQVHMNRIINAVQENRGTIPGRTGSRSQSFPG